MRKLGDFVFMMFVVVFGSILILVADAADHYMFDLPKGDPNAVQVHVP